MHSVFQIIKTSQITITSYYTNEVTVFQIKLILTSKYLKATSSAINIYVCIFKHTV